MYALVDANSFYASCERVFQPELRDRPVVVLSNNDGCIIARSKNVAVFSSNYTLYADMSRRFQDVLRRFADEMEVYSIDESFLHWSSSLPWWALGRQITATVLQWTGLPVCAGFAPTKTLAKLANHLAKKGDGVLVLDSTDAVTDALARVELSELWGISSGFCRRLSTLGITTPCPTDPATIFAFREVRVPACRRLSAIYP